MLRFSAQDPIHFAKKPIHEASHAHDRRPGEKWVEGGKVSPFGFTSPHLLLLESNLWKVSIAGIFGGRYIILLMVQKSQGQPPASDV